MKINKPSRLFKLLCFSVGSFLTASNSHAQVQYATPGTAYLQDFNCLSTAISGTTPVLTTTGASGPWLLDTFSVAPFNTYGTALKGWQLLKISGSATNLGFVNKPANISTPNFLNLSTTASAADKAIGALYNSQLMGAVGVAIQNKTGHRLKSFRITYKGEQWRTTASAQTLTLKYALNPTAPLITAPGASFVTLSACTFTAPNTTNTVVNGDSARNSRTMSALVENISVEPDQFIVFRWEGSSSSQLGIDDVQFIGYPVAPTVNVTGVANVTTTTATLLGKAVSDYPTLANVSDRGFVFDALTNTYANKTSVGITGLDSIYSLNISGLLPNKKYYVKGFASNAVPADSGLVYSTEAEFVSASMPPIIKKATKIGGNVATANWSQPVGNSGAEPYLYKVECSLNSNFSGTVLAADSLASTTTSYTFSGLLPANKYYVRALVRNANALSAASALDSFTTIGIDTGAIAALKQVALLVARDRIKTDLDSAFTAEAAKLAADTLVLLARNIASPIAIQRASGFNPTPTVTVNNPYIDTLNAWGAQFINTTYWAYPSSKATVRNKLDYTKATTTTTLFPKATADDVRNIGYYLERLYWLLLSPHSNYRGHPELFKRYLKYVYASSDDYLINGTDASCQIPGSSSCAWNDWFANARITDAWRLADVTFGQLIPDTILAQIRLAATKAGNQTYACAQALNNYVYTNRDVSYAETLINTGLHFNNPLWQNFGNRIIDTIYNFALFPDGAYNYYMHQNEVPNYHNLNNEMVAKYWVVSEYENAWKTLTKSVNYELLTIEPKEVAEYYSVPAWKTMWNGSTGVTENFLLGVTKNPWLKTRFDSIHRVGNREPYPLNISFYDNTITGAPLPDQYVCYDRNIQGPRARYDSFSYAITTRNVSPGATEVGLQTYVGAMNTQDTSLTTQRLLNSSLMAVHSKVHIKKSTPLNEWNDWAYLNTKINPKTCVGATATTISSTSKLQYQTTGPKGVEVNWASFQQWITLPDRLIGVVETYPSVNNTLAYEVDTRIKFTYGRSGLRTKKKDFVIQTKDTAYTYGMFKVRLLGRNYGRVDTITAGIIRDDFREAKEIKLWDSNRDTITNKPYSTRYDSVKFVVVEIRRNRTIDTGRVANVSRTGTDSTLKVLTVAIDNKRFIAYRNLATTGRFITLPTLPSGNVHQMLFARGDSITKQPRFVASADTFTLAANEQVLIVSTNTPATDTGRGWNNYDDVLQNSSTFATFAEPQQPQRATPERVAEVNAPKQMRLLLQPNPAVNRVVVNYASLASASFKTLRVVDATGKVVHLATLGNNSYGSYPMNTDALQKGIYFVQLIDGGQVATSRLLIAK